MNEMKELGKVKTLAITCRQFGDTGKGKFVDLFADWADIIVRGTGGDNAGHSIYADGQEIVNHIIPSGILRDYLGVVNIIGNGTVVYPRSVIKELDNLEAAGLSYDNLKIAYNAKLILPPEIVMDRVSESVAGEGKIGSTGKGIGPTYGDFIARHGLVVNDLLNPDFFRKKLKRHLEYYKTILRNYDPEVLRNILWHEHLESGLYYDEHDIFYFDSIYEQYLKYGQKLKPFIIDADNFVRERVGKKKILLEGAQGDLLSIDRGTYPFVTSSDSTVAGLAKGAGLKESDVDLSLGIIKGFYMTRVGRGPFPTELGDYRSDDWCGRSHVNRKLEKELYDKLSINDKDEFFQGIALRQVGCEYGATTKRPRRTGWLDLPLLRYTLGFNSKDIILTKLDVLNDFETIKICKEYKYEGPSCCYAGKQITSGDILTVAVPEPEILKNCTPIYESFPGWKTSLKACKSFEDLPKELKNILEYIVEQTGIKPRIISIGPDREETIFI